MQTQSDDDLLREYTVTGSESAFGEIVRRYADFVYSAALRQVGDAEQARDVAQTVFVDLARKAGGLRANTLLIGWLCQGTRLAALEQRRKEQRRHQRERQAMDLLDPSPELPNDWNSVRPVLDEAIASLSHEDRSALLLRFFKNGSLASVGAALGVSEDAAQKRVSRALEKLRSFLAGRGIKTTAAALSAALVANAVQSAPTGFTASVVIAALAKAAAAGSSTAPILKLFTMTNMKTAMLILTLAGGLAGFTVLQANSQRQLRDARALAQQQAGEIDALRAANERLASLTNELERLRGEARDALRLRGEITRLRHEQSAQKPVALQNESPSQAAARANFSEPQIHIGTKFLLVPASRLDTLNKMAHDTLQPANSAQGTSLLTDEQFKAISEILGKAEDVEIVGEGQVTTLNGRQAQIQAAPSAPAGNTQTNIGMSLDVISVFSTNSSTFDLSLTAQLFQFVGTWLPQNGSQQNVKLKQFDTTADVPDGLTVLMQKDVSDDGWHGPDFTNSVSGPRSLVVFVTPTAIDSAGNRIFSGDTVPQDATSTSQPVHRIPVQLVPAQRVTSQPDGQ